MKKPRNPFSRRFWWRSLSLASLLWLAVGQMGAPSPAGDAASAASGKRTAAYVYDRAGLTLRDSDADKLNQLNYSFALIQNGEVSGSHWQSIGAFKAYVQKHPHITPVLSIGGWGADGFSQAAGTAEGRTRFVESTLALMERHGFLGVDIDWEYPGSSMAGIAAGSDDKANFTLLLSELRKGLDELTARDGKQRLLAVALGASPSLVSNIDAKSVGAIVDQVNLMTYDLQTTGVASHHTALYANGTRYPLSAASAVNAYVSAGIPKSKIMLGAAFYAHVYTLSQPSNNPLFTSANSGQKTMNYTNLQSFLNAATVYFDEQAKAPYATDGTTFVTYDNAESIRHKGAYVVENGLMGMMCWEYGGDSSGELLSAMHSGMR